MTSYLCDPKKRRRSPRNAAFPRAHHARRGELRPLPAENWSGFYAALDAADSRAMGDWREKLRDAMRSFRRHRRVVLGGLFLALALAFFTLVPAEMRAIAERMLLHLYCSGKCS
ncbi:MAG: hypothetical protein R2881_05630 [Eubacteriales bacterium]